MIEQMLPEHIEDVKVTDKVAHYGRVCLRDYVFPSIKCRIGINMKAATSVAFRIVVQNGYGGSALRIHAGGIDFYCMNGMVRGDYSTTYKRHTSGLIVSDLRGLVTQAIMSFADSSKVWESWAIKRVSADTVSRFFNAISPSRKMREGLFDQYLREVSSRGASLWSVYSALTYYASHNDGVFKLRRTTDDQDSTVSAMMQREVNVSRWTQTKEWRQLEEV
jgi:hypothetical protein